VGDGVGMTGSEWRGLSDIADETYRAARTAYGFSPGSYTFDAMQSSGFLKLKMAEGSREAIFVEAWAEYHA